MPCILQVIKSPVISDGLHINPSQRGVGHISVLWCQQLYLPEEINSSCQLETISTERRIEEGISFTLLLRSCLQLMRCHACTSLSVLWMLL